MLYQITSQVCRPTRSLPPLQLRVISIICRFLLLLLHSVTGRLLQLPQCYMLPIPIIMMRRMMPPTRTQPTTNKRWFKILPPPWRNSYPHISWHSPSFFYHYSSLRMMHGQFKVVDEWVAPLAVGRRVEAVRAGHILLLLRVDIRGGIREDIRRGIILGRRMLLLRLVLVHSIGELTSYFLSQHAWIHTLLFANFFCPSTLLDLLLSLVR